MKIAFVSFEIYPIMHWVVLVHIFIRFQYLLASLRHNV